MVSQRLRSLCRVIGWCAGLGAMLVAVGIAVRPLHAAGLLAYQSRISGPLFDRIDMHVEVQSVTAADLTLPPAAEGNAEVAARVATARQVQRERFEGHAIRTNAEAEGELLDRIAKSDAAGSKLLTEAAERMKLSARGYHRVLKVARTIADLAGTDTVAKAHIAEALSYRRITHI